MRFKQNERRAALKALRDLIRANDKSIDERAATISDHLFRWRRARMKGNKIETITLPDIKPISDNIETLLYQNRTLETMLSDLEALIGPDLGDEKGKQ